MLLSDSMLKIIQPVVQYKILNILLPELLIGACVCSFIVQVFVYRLSLYFKNATGLRKAIVFSFGLLSIADKLTEFMLDSEKNQKT